MKSRSRVLIAGLFVSMTFGFLSCTNCSQREITRTTSPTGEFDAVLVAELCGGAAGSVAYEVYVAKKGKSSHYAGKERVLTATGLKRHRLRWSSTRILEIEYATSYIHSFVNFVYLNKGDPASTIEVVLKKIEG